MIMTFMRRNPYLVVLNTCLLILFVAPLPRGVPGESPDYHVPKEIGGFWPIPARIRGVNLCFILCFGLRFGLPVSC